MAKLSMTDTTLLLLETPESPKHVAGLLLFELPQNYSSNFFQEILTAFRESEIVPPFNQKLHWPLFSTPSLVEDENLDLDYHIRHSGLPQPGTMEELLTLVSRLHSRLLDRSRPLWEFHLIEGLEDRRFALYYKVHHATIDGASGVMRMIASLNTSPDDKAMRPAWAPVLQPHRKKRDPLSSMQRLMKTATALGAQAKVIPELSKNILTTGLQTLASEKGHPYIPFTAPRTLLNEPVGVARRIAIQTLSLERVKKVSKAARVTVNDVILAVVDGAVNRYLREKQALPDVPLVVEAPTSLRQEGDTRATTQVALLMFRLGSKDADPLTRLQEINAASMLAKQDARAMSQEALTEYTLLTGGIAEILDRLQISRELPPMANLLVSNVPAPSEPLYLNGARFLGCYPISVLLPNLSMNVTILTYLDSMDFGMVACRKALPDLDKLASYLGDFFAELEAVVVGEAEQKAVASTPSTAPKKRATKPAPKAASEPTKVAASTQSTPAKRRVTGSASRAASAPKKVAASSKSTPSKKRATRSVPKRPTKRVS